MNDEAQAAGATRALGLGFVLAAAGVLFVLAGFAIVAYLLKREYWKAVR
jgi:hypothetical protein